MSSKHNRLWSFIVRRTTVLVLAGLATPVFGQPDLKTIVLKHVTTSRDFTLEVADLMPESSYDFKLTPPQMTFAQQMVHLSQALDIFLAPVFGEKPNPGNPASMSKKDIIPFIRRSFENAIAKVSKMTPEQILTTRTTDGGTKSGLEAVMAMLDHTTHHRASAEMYLRAKGITPAEYQF